MTTVAKIIETLKALESLHPDTISLYLIKKSASKNEQKIFLPTLIKIQGDPADAFSNILTSKLSRIKSGLEGGKIKLKDFYDESITFADLSELKPSAILGFKHMLDTIGQYDQIRSISRLQDEEKFHFYACEFQFDSEQVIYFRYSSYKNLINKGNRVRNWFKFLDGTFTKIEGDIFTFDEEIDCVYIKSIKSIIVLDKTSTENMFGFKEYYIEFATNTLKNLQDEGKISITSDMLNLENKIALSKRITNVAKADRFNKPIESFQRCHDFFQQHVGEYREELTQIDIQSEKLNIDTDDKLETYAHLSNQDIVRDIMSEELFISFKKDTLKKRS